MSAYVTFRNEISDADGYAEYLKAAQGSLEPSGWAFIVDGFATE